MKIICTQENLAHALTTLGRIPKRDATLPILGNVLIEAEANTIKISATDLELGMVVTVRGKVEREGSLTAPATLLQEYITSLPHQNVTCEAEGESLTITCGTFTSTLYGMNRDEFPLIPSLESENVITISSEDLAKNLPTVVPFSTSDETRPEITGVYLAREEKNIIFAATDGFRLAEVKIPFVTATQDFVPCIIPRQAMGELTRILQEGGNTQIVLSENQIAFHVGDTLLVSRLIQGQYPNYRDLLPASFETQATTLRDEFMHAVKTTSLFSKAYIQDITLTLGQKEADLKSEASQVGESKGTLPIENTGSENSITFNARYLLEGINNFHSERVTLNMNSATEPAVLTSKENPNYFYLLMPIKR